MSWFITNNKPINLSIPSNLTNYTICNFNPNNFYLIYRLFWHGDILHSHPRKIKKPYVCGFLCLFSRTAFSNNYSNDFRDHKQEKDLKEMTECTVFCHINVLIIRAKRFSIPLEMRKSITALGK